MAMIWGGNRSAWDITNPKNFVINKSFEQNLNEFSTGMQIIGTVIPEALAYKSIARFGATMISTEAATAATSTAGATAGVGGLGAAGAITGASLIGLATTGAKLGFDVYLLEWLQKNWWIPTLLMAAYIGIKVVK